MQGMAWLWVWKIKPLFLLVVTTASRNFKWNGSSLSRPKGKAGGIQNERVTCRPLRLHKDHILGLRTCLASSHVYQCYAARLPSQASSIISEY